MTLKYESPNDQKWKEVLAATAGTPGLPVIIPGFVIEVLAIVIPGGGGTASLEYTADDEASVDSDPTNANWVAWDAGTVSAITGRTAKGGVTAVRLIATTSDATAKLSGQTRN